MLRHFVFAVVAIATAKVMTAPSDAAQFAPGRFKGCANGQPVNTEGRCWNPLSPKQKQMRKAKKMRMMQQRSSR